MSNIEWNSKTIFLDGKTGQEIADEQNKINADKDTKIIASTPFKRIVDGNVVYDCFIFVLENPNKIVM